MTADTAAVAGRAWIAGAPVTLSRALDEAVRRLRGCRNLVVAGLGTDVDGVRAAVALARLVGGAIDHADAAALLRDLDVMRRAGWMVTTPVQARARADVVLIVGDDVDDTLFDAPPTLTAASARRLLRIGATSASGDTERVSLAGGDVIGTLAALRAIVNGRRTTLDEPGAGDLQACAAALRSAAFGVVAWNAGALDALAIEIVCGLVDDLNRTTFFAGLPLAPQSNGGAGATQTMAALTGYPPRTGFARGDAVHDPWTYDAARMVASGEADGSVWVSALSTAPPSWTPTVALVAAGTALAAAPDVAIEVGTPGTDHDALLLDARIGAIAFRAATRARPTPRAGTILDAIAAGLAGGSASC